MPLFILAKLINNNWIKNKAMLVLVSVLQIKQMIVMMKNTRLIMNSIILCFLIKSDIKSGNWIMNGAFKQISIKRIKSFILNLAENFCVFF